MTRFFNINNFSLLFILYFFIACNSQHVFNKKIKIDHALDEVSAIEMTSQSSTYWVIEDSGNKNILYGLDKKGKIEIKVEIINAKNKDWEDLTTDKMGNLYIGDFGNNAMKSRNYIIYKIKAEDLTKEYALAEKIEFKLPKKTNAKDFEAFFVFQDNFYIFSKENKQTEIFKVPNLKGKHRAEFVKLLNLQAKKTKITSAAISPNGKKIALLNHDKVWMVEGLFAKDISGDITINPIELFHDSQKEGICFTSNTSLLISDERHKKESYIYTLDLQ